MSHCELHSLNDLLQVEGANGQPLPYVGFVEVELSVPESKTKTYLLLVVPTTTFSKDIPVLLGTNILFPFMNECKDLYGVQFLQRAKLDTPWELSFRCLATQEKNLNKSSGILGKVKSVDVKVRVPPRTTLSIDGLISKPTYYRKFSIIIQQTRESDLPQCLQIVPTIVNYDPANKDPIPVMVSNMSCREQVIYPRTFIAEVAPIRPDQLCNSLSVKEDLTNEKSEEQNSSFLNEIDFSECVISENELDEVKQFLSNWKHVFSQHETDIGHTNILEHQFHLTDYKPINQRCHRIPPSALEELREHLGQLLEAGIIRRSTSPWASNIVIVRKKNGKMRMCVDYRELNKRTVRDSYSLPRIDELLDCLGGNKYFSILDMKSGYHQVEIREDHKMYTAFTTGPLGLYEFNRLPFGVCNAPSLYQRLMSLCLGELNFSICLVYIDNIIVFSKSIPD